MRTLLRVDLPAESHPTSPSLLALLAGRSLKVDGIGIREEDEYRGASQSYRPRRALRISRDPSTRSTPGGNRAFRSRSSFPAASLVSQSIGIRGMLVQLNEHLHARRSDAVHPHVRSDRSVRAADDISPHPRPQSRRGHGSHRSESAKSKIGEVSSTFASREIETLLAPMKSSRPRLVRSYSPRRTMPRNCGDAGEKRAEGRVEKRRRIMSTHSVFLNQRNRAERAPERAAPVAARVALELFLTMKRLGSLLRLEGCPLLRVVPYCDWQLCARID